MVRHKVGNQFVSRDSFPAALAPSTPDDIHDADALIAKTWPAVKTVVQTLDARKSEDAESAYRTVTDFVADLIGYIDGLPGALAQANRLWVAQRQAWAICEAQGAAGDKFNRAALVLVAAVDIVAAQRASVK